MFQEEVPVSSRGPDQVWFSMIMVNDPNAALFGVLRPSRPHPIVAALRRPLERLTSSAAPKATEPEEPAFRPRRSRWIAAGLVLLGFGLAEAVLEHATAPGDEPRAAAAARVGTTTLADMSGASRATAAAPSAAAQAPHAALAALAATDAHRASAPLAASVASRDATSASVSARSSEPSARADAPARSPRAEKTATAAAKKKAAARKRKAAFGRARPARRAAGR